MVIIKEYKCNFKHCKCDEVLTDENREVVNGKSYHRTCLRTKNDIVEIRDYYIENVSSTVVIGMLVKVINNIIFDKQVNSQFLKFALKYAVETKISIKSPLSLHYLIDNSKIKDVWKRKQTDGTKNDIKTQKTSEITSEFDFDAEVISTTKTASNSNGFENILRRK